MKKLTKEDCRIILMALDIFSQELSHMTIKGKGSKKYNKENINLIKEADEVGLKVFLIKGDLK